MTKTQVLAASVEDKRRETAEDRRADEQLQREYDRANGVIRIILPLPIDAEAYLYSHEPPRTYGKQHRNSIHRGRR